MSSPNLHSDCDYTQQISDYYRYQLQQVSDKFKQITTDSMEEIKQRMKRKQTKVSQEENIGLIEQERFKIRAQMVEHVAQCQQKGCASVEGVHVMYNLFKGNDKVDVLTFIGKRGVEGLGMELQGCEVGKELNRRMNETHRIMKAI